MKQKADDSRSVMGVVEVKGNERGFDEVLEMAEIDFRISENFSSFFRIFFRNLLVEIKTIPSPFLHPPKRVQPSAVF
jgi:hypothetical protein